MKRLENVCAPNSQTPFTPSEQDGLGLVKPPERPRRLLRLRRFRAFNYKDCLATPRCFCSFFFSPDSYQKAFFNQERTASTSLFIHQIEKHSQIMSAILNRETGAANGDSSPWKFVKCIISSGCSEIPKASSSSSSPLRTRDVRAVGQQMTGKI